MDNQKLIGELRVGVKRLMDDIKDANRELEKINQGKDFKEINVRADISKVQSEVQQLNQTLAKTTDLNINTKNAVIQLDKFKQQVLSVGKDVQQTLSDMSKLNLGTGISASIKQKYDNSTGTAIPLNPEINYGIDFGKIAKERQSQENAVEKQLQEEYVRGWTTKIKEVEERRITAIKAEDLAEKQLQDEYVRGWTAKIKEVDTRNKSENQQKISEQNSLYQQQEQIMKQIHQTNLKMIKAKETERVELEVLNALDQKRLNTIRGDISSKNLINEEKQVALKAQELRYQQEIEVAEAKQFDPTEQRLNSLTGGKSFFGKLFNSAAYLASYYILNAIQTTIKDSITFTNELNKAQTNIQMITGMNSEKVQQLTRDYSDLAAQLHETTSNIMTASEEFLRAGNTAEETAKLIEASTLMSKIAGTSQEEAAQSMIAIMNSYKMSATEMISVVDKMVAVDNTSATSTRELSAAIKDTAQSAQLAGSSFDNIISYIGTVSSVSRKSADTIGQGFKTIYQRYSSIREGMNVDQLGEDISNVEKDLASIGIHIRSDVGTFKDFDVVIEELSGKWSTLSDVQKSQLTQDLAGNRQREILLTLLENMNMAFGMQETEANSAGNAMARYSVYAQSTEAKIADLTNAIQQMWMKTMSSDVINGVIEVFTKIVRVFSNLGGIIPVVAGALSGILVAAIGSVITWVKTLIVQGIQLNIVMGGLPIIIGAAVAGLTMLGFAIANNTSEYDNLIKKQKQLDESYNDLVRSSGDSAKSQQGQAQVAESLAKKLDVLTSKESLNVAQKQEMKAIVEQLNKLLPNLNLQIDEQTGKITGNTSAIYDNIEALKSQAIAQGYQSKANAAGTAFANQEELLGQSQLQLDQVDKEYQDLLSKYAKQTANTVPSAITIGRKIILQEDVEAKGKEVKKLKDLVAEQTDQLNKYGNAIDDYTTKALKYAPKTTVPVVDDQLPPSFIPDTTGSSAKTTDPYSATINQFQKYEDALALVNYQLERNNILTDMASEKDKINLLSERVKLLQKEQIALHDLAEERRKAIGKNVGTLNEYGLDTTYDASTNNLQIKNYDNLDSIAKKYAKSQGMNTEQTNTFVKSVEDLVSTTRDLNSANKDAGNSYVQLDKDIKTTIISQSDALKNLQDEAKIVATNLVNTQKDIDEVALKSYKNTHQTIIDGYQSELDILKLKNEVLQDQNDLAQKALDIQNAQIDLTKAQTTLVNTQNEKNVRILRDGKWQWEANQQEVIKAQEDVKTAQENLLSAQKAYDQQLVANQENTLQRKIDAENILIDKAQKTFDTHYADVDGMVNKMLGGIGTTAVSIQATIDKWTIDLANLQKGGTVSPDISSATGNSSTTSTKSIANYSDPYYAARAKGDWQGMEAANKAANELRGLGAVVTATEDIKKIRGYDSGGVKTGDGLAYLHNQERVLTPTQTKSFDRLVDIMDRLPELRTPISSGMFDFSRIKSMGTQQNPDNQPIQNHYDFHDFTIQTNDGEELLGSLRRKVRS